MGGRKVSCLLVMKIRQACLEGSSEKLRNLPNITWWVSRFCIETEESQTPKFVFFLCNTCHDLYLGYKAKDLAFFSSDVERSHWWFLNKRIFYKDKLIVISIEGVLEKDPRIKNSDVSLEKGFAHFCF